VIPEASLVSVLQMHGLVGAVCWQIRRPKIILPAEIDRLSDSELEMIVRHEWAHLERSDPGGLFIQRIVEIVYWYHPLVWFATMQLGKYREFVCDDAVVHSGFSPADYALCLGQLAVWYYAPMPLAPAGLGLLWTQHLVLLRVRRLLDQPRLSHEMRRPQRMSLHLAAALVLMLCSIIRFDWQVKASTMSVVRWTAWPTWAAAALDTVGWQLRDFPLDAHRYDPHAALQHGTSTSEHAKAN
jgi:hypothetical protein